MSKFMNFSGNGETYVNLDHVYWIKEGHGGNDTDVHFTNGTVKTYKGTHRVAQATAPVIPAAPGWELVSFLFAHEDEESTLRSDNRQPIIGWRVWRLDAVDLTEPVVVNQWVISPLQKYGCHAILRPDGVVTEPGFRNWNNLGEWLEYVRSEWRKYRMEWSAPEEK